MAKTRWKLTDERWVKLAPLFPEPKVGKKSGRPRASNRKVFEWMVGRKEAVYYHIYEHLSLFFYPPCQHIAAKTTFATDNIISTFMPFYNNVPMIF